MKRVAYSLLTFLMVLLFMPYAVFSASAYVTGDINIDGEVDLNDAILLLQHSMFPELYVLEYERSVDFTQDGDIDMNDAILLLQHSMFPELYPLVDEEQVPAYTATEDAYTLVYNKGMAGSKEGINSGWVFDNRGGAARVSNTGYGTLGDVSEKYATAYIREFNLIESGRLVTELSISAIDDGTFVEFRDSSEDSTYYIEIIDGEWCILDRDGEASVLQEAEEKTLFRIVTDLDKGIGETYINGNYCGEAQLLSDDILSLRIGIDEEGTGSLSISRVNIVVNYCVYENFELFGTAGVYDWKTSGDIYWQNDELYFDADSSARKLFSPIEGNVTLETYFNSYCGEDFKINFGNILSVDVKDGSLSAGGKELYEVTPDMWYRLRVDANTESGKAKVWLNGKVIGNVNLDRNAAVSSIGIFSYGELGIDNIKVYGTVEHEDYCPEPETAANLNDYVVAVNVCSLWRNGTHYGWACITPYDEPTPVLGYYDEGNPETADWEIKYMVEHGIDVQAFCWYGDVSSGAIKTPNWSEQLHDGYMYAKYSDYMKYVIQWETSASKNTSSEQFRNYVVPYWFENYFLDDRYLKLENKIVLPIYNIQRLATDYYFGSNEGFVEELDYLESIAYEYGFDGFIILASGTPSSQLENMYVDGTYAYNWGEDGRKAQQNINKIRNAASSSSIVHAIPTVSVGFDSIPWHHLRHGLMSAEDYEYVLEWVRDTHLPNDKDKPSWAENLVWLSTWNEYGEGTYISPGGQNGNGFGYIDGVRHVFTDLSDKHTDIVPTENQLKRITHMYPQYARLLRREGWYKYESNLETINNEPKNKLYINDIDILANTTEEFHLPPVINNGKVYFPFNPSTAVNYILGCHYEWRKDAGTLRILANGHEVKFRVGSARYQVDGTYYDLAGKLETLDGVPLLDFVLLANDLGYEVNEENGNVYIYTDTYEDVWVKYHNRKTGAWEFDDYDSEGWDSTHFDLTVGGGTMLMTTNGNNDDDPVSYYSEAAFPKDFYTKRYTDFEMRVKYNYDTSWRQTFVLYYITDIDSTWNEEKTIKFSLRNKNSWRIYSQDLSELIPWQNAGRITGLRLDPFNCSGTFEIDYIRFIEDPDFEYVEPEETEFEILNGDAEDPDVNRFYSGNADISIAEDPENPENHAYLIESASGNQYAYIRYAAEYEPGATYRVEYDVKLIGSYSDNPDNAETEICCNLRYRDKTASNSIEHVIKNLRINVDDGWVHVTVTHTVNNIGSNSGAEFTIYANPQNGEGFNYMLDNISIVKVE